ncbi:MAG: gamma carbonic anhydrase family protein [Rhodocyclaceae bacterium]|nr:gamma carbonic anhydrase family protein [Rhodocyclaceae bacterium]
MPLYSLEDKTPTIDPSAWVAENATVIGDVTLGAEASVWWNTVIRGDNDRSGIRIGARTNIQDACVLHSDEDVPLTIGADVTVGHMVMLHGCTVGDGCLVGIGSIILNRAVVGAGSIVGANTLIPEGKVFPERVLIVGSPGRVVRELSPEESARLLKAAAGYVENARRFAGGLRKI